MYSPGKNNAPPVLYIRTCKKIKKHDSLLSKYLCLASNPGAGFLSKCKDHLHSLGKMSLFTAFSGKGSITVETAAVLPLFLLFFLSLSVFFQTLHVQSRADLSLMQSSREMAVLQYGAETGGTDQPGAAVAVGTVYAQGKLLLACPPAYQKQKGIGDAGDQTAKRAGGSVRRTGTDRPADLVSGKAFVFSDTGTSGTGPCCGDCPGMDRRRRRVRGRKIIGGCGIQNRTWNGIPYGSELYLSAALSQCVPGKGTGYQKKCRWRNLSGM